MRSIRFLASILSVAILGVLVGWPADAKASGQLPVVYSREVAIAAGLVAYNTPPAGANDWSCRPSAAHPRPVVLVNGTFENEQNNWYTASPVLFNAGYCVFTFNYGAPEWSQVKSVGPMEDSALTMRDFIAQVLAATGASQVDLVGHSQGGTLSEYYVKFIPGGAAQIHTIVGIGATSHGSSVDGLVQVENFLGITSLNGLYCYACEEQFTGSDFITHLNANGDTVPGVRYTMIASRYDEAATPDQTTFLNGPNATNITLQDGCPVDFSGHVQLVFNPRVMALMLNALDPLHPRPVPCYPQVFGG